MQVRLSALPALPAIPAVSALRALSAIPALSAVSPLSALSAVCAARGAMRPRSNTSMYEQQFIQFQRPTIELKLQQLIQVEQLFEFQPWAFKLEQQQQAVEFEQLFELQQPPVEFE